MRHKCSTPSILQHRQQFSRTVDCFAAARPETDDFCSSVQTCLHTIFHMWPSDYIAGRCGETTTFRGCGDGKNIHRNARAMHQLHLDCCGTFLMSTSHYLCVTLSSGMWMLLRRLSMFFSPKHVMTWYVVEQIFTTMLTK